MKDSEIIYKSKDPAVLFYFNDWHGGTSTFSRHLKGCYMDLLHAQFNSGHLSLEEIRTVLGQDQASWTVLSKKFKQDENGLFYNERLEAEMIKRRNYCASRSKNRKGTHDESYDKTYDSTYEKDMFFENNSENGVEAKTGENIKSVENDQLANNELNNKKDLSYDKTYDASHEKHMSIHMENENENRNINRNNIRKGVKGETEKKEVPSWKNDLKIYQDELRAAWKRIVTPEYIAERQKYHPNLDIKLSLEKACKDYWFTEAGQKKKIKDKVNVINWETTFNNALALKSNQVLKNSYAPKNTKSAADLASEAKELLKHQ